MTSLGRANLALLATLVLHDVDHVVNQADRSLAVQVTATGLFGLASSIVITVLALRRHALAPLGSIALGFGNVAGLVAVHLTPKWSAFADPYSNLELNVLSWLGVIVPMAVALGVGVLGLRALRPAVPSAA